MRLSEKGEKRRVRDVHNSLKMCYLPETHTILLLLNYLALSYVLLVSPGQDYNICYSSFYWALYIMTSTDTFFVIIAYLCLCVPS